MQSRLLKHREGTCPGAPPLSPTHLSNEQINSAMFPYKVVCVTVLNQAQ